MTKTELTEEGVEDILRNYNLGRLSDFSYFERGVEHTNVLLNTSLGKYVLRIYERGRTKEFVAFELKLLNRLTKYNFPTPRPLRTSKNKLITSFKGKPAVVFEYIKGIHIKHQNQSHVSQVGKTLAEMHMITKGFKPKGYKIRWNADVSEIRKLADKLTKEGKKNNIKNVELVERVIKSEFKSFEFPENIPKGTIHADLFKDNVKFYKGKLQGVLDFDDAFYGRLIDDLNTAILGWCFPNNKFNLRLARQMVTSYQRAGKLSDLEKRYFYQSLRFMGVKFSVYLLNRMKKDKNARSFIFERLLSLQRESKEKFEKAVLE
jgi:homoserine kinase type II